jgi:hypothetical protein
MNRLELSYGKEISSFGDDELSIAVLDVIEFHARLIDEIRLRQSAELNKAPIALIDEPKTLS